MRFFHIIRDNDSLRSIVKDAVKAGRVAQILAWVCLSFAMYGRVSAQTWTPANLFDKWTSVAMSADGSMIAASSFFGGIDTTTDGGTTWLQLASPEATSSVLATSTNGSNLVVAFYGGHIYTSADWALNWTQSSAVSNAWQCLASSADGTRLVAGTSPGLIYTSKDSGATFTSRLPQNNGYQAMAGSADGSRLVAVVFHGRIYQSTDSGDTWMATTAPVATWFGVSSSTNGLNLAAIVQNGGIYTSTDGGVNWNLSSAPSANWSAIAASADGSTVAAAVNGGPIYLSTDAGADWNVTGSGSNLWSAIEISPDGSRLVALANRSGNAFLSTNGGANWSQQFIDATPFITNVICSDSYNLSIVSSNVNSHAFTTNTFQTNFTTVNLLVSNPLLSITNVVGYSLPKIKVSGTSQAALASMLGIRVLGNVVFGPGVNTNLLGTNELGIGVSIAKQSPSNTVVARLVIPGGVGSSSTNLTNNFASQIPGISVMISNVLTVQAVVANNSQQGWSALTASADGTHLAAVADGGLIYGSSDQGVTWLAMSGLIRVSTNGGAAWLATNVVTSPNLFWAAAASTGDGTRLTAAVANGGIFTSTNFGANWISNGVPWPIADGEIPKVGTNFTWQAQGTMWISNNVPRQNWSAIFSSADGETLMALARFGLPYKSTDGGGTWTQMSTPSAFWQSIASSADGSNLLAAPQGGFLYQSTNAGATWQVLNVVHAVITNLFITTVTTTNANNHSVSTNISAAASASTNVITAGSLALATLAAANMTALNTNLVGTNTTILTTAAGLTLSGTQIVPFAPINIAILGTNQLGVGKVRNASLASNILNTLNVPGFPAFIALTNLAVVNGFEVTNAVYTNVFSFTFTNVNVMVTNFLGIAVITEKAPQTWSAVASSADGSHLAAVVNGGSIFVSTDAGASWIVATAPTANWTSVAMSADGSKLVAGTSGGFIYASGDSGTTWVAATVPPANWSDVALSADGSVQAATIRGGSIYTGQGVIIQGGQQPVPLLYISPADGGGVAVEWPLGLNNYVLQEKAGLAAAWVNVPAATIVTNGLSLMARPMTTGNCFFRLLKQ